MSGSSYNSQISVAIPVSELAQTWFGAPAIVRISVSVLTYNRGLDKSDGGLNIDIGDVLLNVVRLPLTRVIRNDCMIKYLGYFAGNLVRISSTTKIKLEFSPYSPLP